MIVIKKNNQIIYKGKADVRNKEIIYYEDADTKVNIFFEKDKVSIKRKNRELVSNLVFNNNDYSKHSFNTEFGKIEYSIFTKLIKVSNQYIYIQYVQDENIETIFIQGEKHESFNSTC